MGEAERRKRMNESDRPIILETCPVCRKEFVADGKKKLLLTSYMVPQGQAIGGQLKMAASLPKVACTDCGIEFFPKEALIELRKRADGERSNIVVPKSIVRLN